MLKELNLKHSHRLKVKTENRKAEKGKDRKKGNKRKIKGEMIEKKNRRKLEKSCGGQLLTDNVCKVSLFE